MAESIYIESYTSKAERYKQILPQIKSLIAGEKDKIAALATSAAALHQAFNFLWTGFYVVREGELVIGPFQGPVACMRIAKGKGVCGTAWAKNESIVVSDVTEFVGYIACSGETQSEIVIPIRNSQAQVVAVMDVDSAEPAAFDNVDQKHLEELCNWIGEHVF